jgi:thymidylate synthase (FAD)
MRHRTWSYNEISRRYTDKDLQFYSPKTFRTQHKTNRQASNIDEINPVIWPDLADYGHGTHADQAINSHIEQSLNLFNKLMLEGVCREQARMVLPQNLYTEYYGTTNLNNLIKFISLRMHDGAQWEIQRVAEACLEIAQSLWPEAVGAYRQNVGS